MIVLKLHTLLKSTVSIKYQSVQRENSLSYIQMISGKLCFLFSLSHFTFCSRLWTAESWNSSRSALLKWFHKFTHIMQKLCSPFAIKKVSLSYEEASISNPAAGETALTVTELAASSQYFYFIPPRCIKCKSYSSKISLETNKLN